MAIVFAFAGSNSSTSINHQWLKYIQQNDLKEMELCNLCERDIPIYDIDTEKNDGIPQTILELFELIQSADYILISSSEHNGSYTSYLKSTFDWLSRYNRDFIRDKKVLITGTSPGRGGAGSSIEASKKFAERMGAQVLATMPLPSWEYAFENGKLTQENQEALENFLGHIK